MTNCLTDSAHPRPRVSVPPKLHPPLSLLDRLCARFSNIVIWTTNQQVEGGPRNTTSIPTVFDGKMIDFPLFFLFFLEGVAFKNDGFANGFQMKTIDFSLLLLFWGGGRRPRKGWFGQRFLMEKLLFFIGFCCFFGGTPVGQYIQVRRIMGVMRPQGA